MNLKYVKPFIDLKPRTEPIKVVQKAILTYMVEGGKGCSLVFSKTEIYSMIKNETGITNKQAIGDAITVLLATEQIQKQPQPKLRDLRTVWYSLGI